MHDGKDQSFRFQTYSSVIKKTKTIKIIVALKELNRNENNFFSENCRVSSEHVGDNGEHFTFGAGIFGLLDCRFIEIEVEYFTA